VTQKRIWGETGKVMTRYGKWEEEIGGALAAKPPGGKRYKTMSF